VFVSALIALPSDHINRPTVSALDALRPARLAHTLEWNIRSPDLLGAALSHALRLEFTYGIRLLLHQSRNATL
jgi:hypothetical protein